jgi:hypothetical protein
MRVVRFWIERIELGKGVVNEKKFLYWYLFNQPIQVTNASLQNSNPLVNVGVQKVNKKNVK